MKAKLIKKLEIDGNLSGMGSSPKIGTHHDNSVSFTIQTGSREKTLEAQRFWKKAHGELWEIDKPKTIMKITLELFLVTDEQDKM